MAIQIPNVGTGVPADQTGDSPWLAMKKVGENFSDQSNAASRLVGTASDQVPLAQNIPSLSATPLTYTTTTTNPPNVVVDANGVLKRSIGGVKTLKLVVPIAAGTAAQLIPIGLLAEKVVSATVGITGASQYVPDSFGILSGDGFQFSWYITPQGSVRIDKPKGLTNVQGRSFIVYITYED